MPPPRNFIEQRLGQRLVDARHAPLRQSRKGRLRQSTAPQHKLRGLKHIIRTRCASQSPFRPAVCVARFPHAQRDRRRGDNRLHAMLALRNNCGSTGQNTWSPRCRGIAHLKFQQRQRKPQVGRTIQFLRRKAEQHLLNLRSKSLIYFHEMTGEQLLSRRYILQQNHLIECLREISHIQQHAHQVRAHITRRLVPFEEHAPRRILPRIARRARPASILQTDHN